MNFVTQLIQGYGDWVVGEYKRGWTPFYVNIMFEPLNRYQIPVPIIVQMQERIEKSFYPELCRRLLHHPERKGRHRYLPHVILFPDLPVPKYSKQSIRDITLNGGLHYNGIISVSPNSREKDLVRHFQEKQSVYARRGIQRVHADRLYDIYGVIDYSMKSIKRHSVNYDSTIILPRALEGTTLSRSTAPSEPRR